MKKFLGFVKKEFFHFFRDPKTLVILFGLPVVQILIFGFVIRNEIRDVRIAILDKSRDPITSAIINRLTGSGFFRIEKYLHSEKEVESVFRAGKVREVVVFENDFAGKLEREKMAGMQIIADASDPNSARMIVSYTQGVVADYLQELNEQVARPQFIDTRVRMMFNADLKSAFMFVPGTMAMILTLVSAMMTCITIVREKEMGTMEALLVSPLRPIQIIAGKVTPYILLSVANAIVILLMGHFVFGLPFKGSLLLLFAETILFISLSLALGILISTMSNSQLVAIFFSAFVLLLPTMLLSGFIFPIENMPRVLQWFCYLIPPKYFLSIIRSVMLKGTGWAEVWQETLVLVGMFIVFLSASAARFKVRLQ
jgi:ABC-2 type transport system permease protein